MKNELQVEGKKITSLAYNSDKKTKVVIANDSSSNSPVKFKFETIPVKKKKKEKADTLSLNCIPTTKMNLVDLDKLYNKIHTKEVAKIITNANKYKRRLAELDKKPNFIMKNEDILHDYFDLNKIKEKYEFSKKIYKVDKTKEKLKQTILQNNIHSIVGQQIKDNEETKAVKMIDDKIADINLENFIKKNRSKSTATEEFIPKPSNEKKNTVFKFGHPKFSSLNSARLSKFNTLSSSKDNSLLLDEERLLKRIKEKTKGSSNTFYNFKEKFPLRNLNYPNSKDVTTQCVTSREPQSNMRTIRVDDETFYKMDNLSNEIQFESNNKLSYNTPSKMYFSGPNTEKKVPQINLNSLTSKTNSNIKGSNINISLTERKNSKRNSATFNREAEDLVRTSSKKINMEQQLGSHNTNTARVSKRTSNSQEPEDEVFKLNKRFLKKYNNIVSKSEIDRVGHKVKNIFEDDQIDLLVNSNLQIDLENLKNEYQIACKIASLSQKEKVIRSLKMFREKKIKTIKLENNNKSDLILTKEKSNNTVVSTKMIENFDKKERKRKLIKKLITACNNATKDYLIIEDS